MRYTLHFGILLCSLFCTFSSYSDETIPITELEHFGKVPIPHKDDRPEDHEHKPPRPPKPPKPPIKKKPFCFDILCHYNRHHHPKKQFEKCNAAIRFVKEVEIHGREIQDNSDSHFEPQYEVECDGNVIYNNSAIRFTGYAGTRIQPPDTPFPAVLLPRNSLGLEHQYTASTLVFSDEELHGYCFITSTPVESIF